MQRRTNLQVSSLINLFGAITILIQFSSYYLSESAYLIWGISSLIVVISCHVILEQTVSYEACFHFSLFTLFISLIILVLSYFGRIHTFMPYSYIMLGIVIVNWLIPCVYCFIRHMFDYSTKIEDYPSFYLKISGIFLFFYVGLLIYAMFITNTFAWAHPQSTTYNLLPFNVISAQIEDYLYGYLPLSTLLSYVLSRILIFLPYGFYLTLLLRKQKRLLRVLGLFLLPFIIEVVQFIIIPFYCDIDDLIYAFIGGLLGSFVFYLTNIIFRAISGKDYLIKDNAHRFSNSKLHF